MNLSLTSLLNKGIDFLSTFCQNIESWMQKDRNRQLSWTLVILIIFGIILALNMLTPLIGDDFGYLYIFGKKEKIGSLSHIVESQIMHYKVWGGRSVVHFIGQFLLWIPTLLADLLNAVIYFLFVILIYFHIKGKSKGHSISLFLLINFSIWFFIPSFGDTMLWITGSANYLWGMTIILSYLWIYRAYDGKRTEGGIAFLLSIPMFLLSIITGWTNENTVAGLIIIIGLFFWYYCNQKWKIPLHLKVGLLGVLLGYVAMIIAPGNLYRVGNEMPDMNFVLILYRIFTYTQTLFLSYGFLLAAIACALVLYKRFGKKYNPSDITVSLIYAIGALVAIYAMVLSPQFPPRAWFGIVTFLLIALGIIFYRLDFEKNNFLRAFRYILLSIFSISFCFSLYAATKDIYRAHLMNKEREIAAKEARQRGDEVCYFRRFTPHTNYVHGEDSEGNMLLSYYYGIFIEFED